MRLRDAARLLKMKKAVEIDQAAPLTLWNKAPKIHFRLSNSSIMRGLVR